jgi:predicted metal-dependent hydrolase
MDQQGPEVVVRRSARRKRTATAYREQDRIVVLLPERLSGADERRYVEELVAKVLAHEARSTAPHGDRELQERARELNDRYLATAADPPPQPASVRWVGNQQQRWGSCTPATGVIRLSDRMRAMPDWVVDYVLVHELAHLQEPSHSARFWSLVSVYPHAERARGFLSGYQFGVDRHAAGGVGRPARDGSCANDPVGDADDVD